MEKLYQTYKDIAEFYIVYISEAHASDDSWPVGYAKKMGIKEHTNFGERCAVAERLVKDKKLTIPFLIDNMDNAASTAYQAWPDRVFLIRKDGRLAVAAARGPWGFKPAVSAARKWLAEYKKSGTEPTLKPKGEQKADFSELNSSLYSAYRSKEYKEALATGMKMIDLRPDDSGTLYNISCLYCLLGEKDKAYTWIEKAIKAGYSDVDQMRGDNDFKTIRDEDRFRNLLQKLSGERKAEGDSVESGDGKKGEPLPEI